MNIVNLLLRLSSALVFIILVHQLFLSRKGIHRHRVVGTIAMWVGALIVVLVTIRGFHQETFSWKYRLHLLAGLPFFYTFFTTGYLGQKTKNNRTFAQKHRRFAYATSILLALTLFFGIISLMSHH